MEKSLWEQDSQAANDNVKNRSVLVLLARGALSLLMGNTPEKAA